MSNAAAPAPAPAAPATPEASAVLTDQDHARWFARKALDRARSAVELLEASEADGGWRPGAARKVRAALSPSKSWLTKSLADRLRVSCLDYVIESVLRYGGANVRAYDRALADVAKAMTQVPASAGSVDWVTVRQALYYFRTLTARMDKLDRTRPRPVFTPIGVSPTVTATLEAAGIWGSFSLSSIRPCPITWHEVESVDAEGRRTTRWVGRLEWPAGTRFASRFAGRSAGRSGGLPCHACGHAIYNPFNWVPVVIDDAQKRPVGLWVGRDCAHNIFGIKTTGKVELENGPDASGGAEVAP